MENTEKNQMEIVLVGAKEIEKTLRRSYIALVTLKTAYGFPLRKTCGQPSVSLKELDAWREEWGNGLPFNKITNEALQARKRRLDILAMRPKPLNSINEIAEFINCPMHEIGNWHRHGVNCPIQRDKAKGYSVDGKELLLWMHDRGLSGNKETRSLDSF